MRMNRQFSIKSYEKKVEMYSVEKKRHDITLLRYLKKRIIKELYVRLYPIMQNKEELYCYKKEDLS